MAENLLYDGDNLDILRRYLRPPFNSNQDGALLQQAAAYKNALCFG